jgi:hypothetical protein
MAVPTSGAVEQAGRQASEQASGRLDAGVRLDVQALAVPFFLVITPISISLPINLLWLMHISVRLQ